MPEDLHLLLCYDGSEEAAGAIDAAAALVPRGSRATVLYVRDLAPVATPGGIVGVAVPPDLEQGDEARAQQVAAAGAERAQRLGLAAEPHVEPSAGAIWETIVALTGPETDLIVMGTRALSGLREVLLGSVAHHVVQHVQRPVLIVPAARSAASAG
jgi:nucleotide-binding universal stress UspA family protein